MNYPIFIDDNDREHTCILWAISLKNGWEWYGFEDEGNGIYFGFVHGFEDEWGTFSTDELTENSVKYYTDPKDLQDIRPPVGWTKKEE